MKNLNLILGQERLTKEQMKKILGGFVPSWPCTQCWANPGNPLGPTYVDVDTYESAIDLSTAQTRADADCAAAYGPSGCQFAVCTDPNDPIYECN